MISSTLTTIGLVLDIVGACIIWRFGLPQNVDRSGHVYIICEETNEKEKLKAKNYDRLSLFGLLLLVLGFVLQIIAAWTNN